LLERDLLERDPRALRGGDQAVLDGGGSADHSFEFLIGDLLVIVLWFFLFGHGASFY
jgi:hypothetical protein